MIVSLARNRLPAEHDFFLVKFFPIATDKAFNRQKHCLSGRARMARTPRTEAE